MKSPRTLLRTVSRIPPAKTGIRTIKVFGSVQYHPSVTPQDLGAEAWEETERMPFTRQTGGAAGRRNKITL